MNHYINKILRLSIFLTMLITVQTLRAQSYEASDSDLPVKVYLMDESIALPGFTFLDYRYNFAVSVGTEIGLGASARDKFYVAPNAGFYAHRYARNAAFLNVQIGYRLTYGRFDGSLRMGPGVAMVYSTTPVYVFSSGDYQAGSNSGQFIFMPIAGLEMSYRIGSRPRAPSVHLQYSFALDTPFGLVPIPHTFVGVGISVYPFR